MILPGETGPGNPEPDDKLETLNSSLDFITRVGGGSLGHGKNS